MCEQIGRSLAQDGDPREAHTEAYRAFVAAGILQGGAAYIAGRVHKKWLQIWLAGDCQCWLVDMAGNLVYDSGITSLEDAPSKIKGAGRAQIGSFPLARFDRLVVASDGVTQNMAMVDIQEVICNRDLSPSACVKKIEAVALSIMRGERWRGDGAHANPDHLSVLVLDVNTGPPLHTPGTPRS